MSRNRFSYIYSKIRFDNRFTREKRREKSGDKLEAIRSIFDKFVANCNKNFRPSDEITIDERLATFRGKCPFKVYMKSKPGRYGIKIWIAADVSTSYICNLQIYTGKKNNLREINQGQRVVLDLIEPYKLSGLSITTDNFFTSVPLAQELLKQNIYLTGTLRANKREIPTEFQASKRDVFSSLFGFSGDLTLVSYVANKTKAVNLLTTKFHNKEISQDETKKPEIILFYNRTKGAVDNGDKMTQEYSCVRATRRWPFRLFMELIDIAALNAFIIWTALHPDWRETDTGRRKVFLRELGKQLAVENIQKRNYAQLHKAQKRSIDIFLKATSSVACTSSATSSVASTSKRTPSDAYCDFCHYKKKRRTPNVCCHCQKSICGAHRYYICPDCLE